MSASLSVLPIFNSTPIADHFDFSTDHVIERKSIAFLYRKRKEDGFFSAYDKSEQHKEACQDVIDKMEFRWDIFCTFYPEFLRGNEEHLDALKITVICDEFTNDINEEEQDIEGNPLGPRDDGFEEELETKACAIWEAAHAIECTGLIPENYEFTQASLLLAQINLFGNLRDYEARLDDYTAEELQKILRDNFEPGRKFVTRENGLGKKLLGYLDYLQPQIEEIIQQKIQVVQRRASFSIVPKTNGPS